jgi:hypothetical protein
VRRQGQRVRRLWFRQYPRSQCDSVHRGCRSSW